MSRVLSVRVELYNLRGWQAHQSHSLPDLRKVELYSNVRLFSTYSLGHCHLVSGDSRVISLSLPHFLEYRAVPTGTERDVFPGPLLVVSATSEAIGCYGFRSPCSPHAFRTGVIEFFCYGYSMTRLSSYGWEATCLPSPQIHPPRDPSYMLRGQ